MGAKHAIGCSTPRTGLSSPHGHEPVWDLCVIGAGPGGYAAAMRAHDLGKRVLLIEGPRRRRHRGALSSARRWHLSADFATAKLTDRLPGAGGIDVTYPSRDGA